MLLSATQGFVMRSFNQHKKIRILSKLILSLKNIKMVFEIFQQSPRSIERYVQLLHNEDYIQEISRVRGLSIEFLTALLFFGRIFLRIKYWLLSNELCNKYSGYFAAFYSGEIQCTRKLLPTDLHFHVDFPYKFFNIVNDIFTITGWAVDINSNSFVKIRVRTSREIYSVNRLDRVDVQDAFKKIGKIPMDVGFSISFLLRPGVHKIWIDIQGVDNRWIPIKRLLILRAPKRIAYHLSHLFSQKGKLINISYKDWTVKEQGLLKAELHEITQHIDLMLNQPNFLIVIDIRLTQVGLNKTLMSIRNQIYPLFELRVLDITENLGGRNQEHGIASFKQASLVDSDFVVFIECGQSLASNALYEFANALNQDSKLDLIYGDNDYLDADGKRCDPFYKPDWSPDYLETFNYIGFPACFRTSKVHKYLGEMNFYELVLKFTETTNKIMHVPKILGHVLDRKLDSAKLDKNAIEDIKALQGRLFRTGRQGMVSEHETYRGCYEIILYLRNQPLVSIIIPTAGKIVDVNGRTLDLIVNVVDQIRNQATYKRIEIIIVDNGDLSIDQKQFLAKSGCKSITYVEPVFNISKKLNLGATIAKGELLLLMNDDIEIINPFCIERMIDQFEKSHVGVVGAKLLYPNGMTQHVGVVHNHGDPDHVRRHFHGDESGYFFSTCGTRNFMAVTGAVMMTPSNIYKEVGGYSEELAVSFNDIDYCLKVQELGLSIVYASKAELIHMESLSRFPFADMKELAWYRKRWARKLIYDPFYNESFLTINPPTFVPCINPKLI